MVAAGGAAAAAAGCLGRGEEAPLAGDAGGDEVRLGWRFSWSTARGDAAPAKAESERDACRFRFRRNISMASYCCCCVLLRRDADPRAKSRESRVGRSGEGRRTLLACLEWKMRDAGA